MGVGAGAGGGGEPGGDEDEEPTAESRLEPSEPDVERRRGGGGGADPRPEGGENAAGMCNDAVITQSSSDPPSVCGCKNKVYFLVVFNKSRGGF